MKALKLYLKVLNLFFPVLAARQIYRWMLVPRIRKVRDFEEAILEKAKKSKIRFREIDIQLYIWGEDSDKKALLVHGWEGQGGNFGGLVDLLLEKGFQVIAFDAPAHGRSSGTKTDMFEFVDLLSILLRDYQPNTIISHSFGSVASAAVLKENPDYQLKNWVMVTTPYGFETYISNVVNFLEISDKTLQILIGIIEKNSQAKVDEMNMATFCANLENVPQALIVHSQQDRIIPIDIARRVNQVFPQSELIELDNLGHYAILWSEELKKILSERLV